nr:MAG TPA: hypothetical protein [Caudoviricetes sp.]
MSVKVDKWHRNTHFSNLIPTLTNSLAREGYF